jgi:hypothetical protein
MRSSSFSRAAVCQPAGVAQLLVGAEMHLDETGPPIGDPVTDQCIEKPYPATGRAPAGRWISN